MTAEIEIFPIGIGEYDHHRPLDVDIQIERLAAILADFDTEIARPWQTPMSDRGRDAVEARLDTWSRSTGGPTVLYWVGHGWSDSQTAALLHARSTDSNGLSPADLARRIATWEDRGDPDRTWLLVVIDACQSAHYLLTSAASVPELLGADHRGVFAAAVRRLAATNTAYRPLLVAPPGTRSTDHRAPSTPSTPTRSPPTPCAACSASPPCHRTSRA